MAEERPSGITRREALKRGAVIGTAAWVVPAVQVLRMDAAAADSPSGAGHGSPGGQSGLHRQDAVNKHRGHQH